MRRCFYEVLGVPKSCSDDDIRKSYRNLALKLHPDKHPEEEPEYTVKFQELKEAYDVLSDAQERAWYDGHRKQILREGTNYSDMRRDDQDMDDSDADENCGTSINLWRYFSRSCFAEFDDSETGFYTVYGKLFREIWEEEVELKGGSDFPKGPATFGGPTSPWQDVGKFYKFWANFQSTRDFGCADRFRVSLAPNRSVRRQMEIENKKFRKAAQKALNDCVQKLTVYVKRRDPRFEAKQKSDMKQATQEASRRAEKKREESAAVRRLQEIHRQRDAAKWAALEKEKESARVRGVVFCEDEEPDVDSEEQVVYVCGICEKNFKSGGAFQSHESSKKHRQALSALRRRLAATEQQSLEVNADGSSSGASPENSLGSCRHQGKATDDGEEEDFEAMESEGEPSDTATCSDDEGVPSSSAAEAETDQRDSSRMASSESEEEVDLEEALSRKQKRERPAAASAPPADRRKPRRAGRRKGQSSAENAGADATANASAPAGTSVSTSTTSRKPQSCSRLPDSKNPPPEAGSSEHRCSTCSSSFSSRNRLHEHLKKTNHAILKGEPTTTAPARSKKA